MEALKLSPQEVEGLDLDGLDSLERVEELTTHLEFDKTEYTSFDTFVDEVINGKLTELNAKGDRKRVLIPNKALSVNGRVIADSMDKYLAADGLSSSALKEALKSPLHFFYHQQKTFKPKCEDHFKLGTFIHSAILEPRKFDRVISEPDAPRNTIEGITTLINFYWRLLHKQPDVILSELKMNALRDKLKELEAEATAQYTIASPEDVAIADVLRRTFYAYGGGLLPLLLQNAKREVSMYGVDPQSGQKVKIRPDAMLLAEDIGINAIVSVKSTSATSLEAFQADCAKFRYELSEGMYLDVASQITGREFTATIMIMAQTEIPYQIAVFYWDAEDLAIGKYKYRQAIEIVAECREKGSYPGFEASAEELSRGVIQMKLPGWIKRELNPKFIEQSN